MAHQTDDSLADTKLRVLRRHGDDHVPSVQTAPVGGDHLRENDISGLVERGYHGRPGALNDTRASAGQTEAGAAEVAVWPAVLMISKVSCHVIHWKIKGVGETTMIAR